MENYRCGRCEAVLTTVAAPFGESSALLLDPLVERRLLQAATRHGETCSSTELTYWDAVHEPPHQY